MKYEQYKGDGNRPPERASEVQSDVEAIRSEMAQTLMQLEERFSVSQIVDEVMSRARRAGVGSGDFVKNLGITVRDHPIPVLLIGVGVASLLSAERSERSFTARSRAGAEQGNGHAHEHLDEMKDKAGHVVERLKEGVHRASDKGSELRGRLGDTVSRARERSRVVVEEQPLVLAGLALAVGAFLAAAPMTEVEQRRLGPKKEALKRSAQEAKERMERAESRQSGEGKVLASSHDEETTNTDAYAGPEGSDRGNRRI